ncbi:MAG: heme exporter protein CcmD [Proteobacteria bacterium]|nr:heme exporter protein CcmD [Pseudomonadota bacterium]
MYFDSFTEFLQMGKHGLYVWLAYGSTALVLLWTWLSAQQSLASVTRRVEQQAQLAARNTQLAARNTMSGGAATGSEREQNLAGYDESET